MKTKSPGKTWTRTGIRNLVRHRSGVYYARTVSGGKQTWKTLRTDILEVAKCKLREVETAVEKTNRATAGKVRGRMTMGDCEVIFRDRLEKGFGLAGRGGQIRRISPGAIVYRKKTIAALLKSWPGLADLDARKVPAGDVEKWAERFSAAYSATVYNNTLDTLRAFFRIAMDAGACADNPAAKVGRVAVRHTAPVLPERSQFLAFVQAVKTGGGRAAHACADFVQFLAFTGARKDEAAHVEWRDIDFTAGRIHLRICKGGALVSRARYVPMIGEARTLLERMRAERPDEPATGRVLLVGEAQGTMNTAAAKVGFARITHHDLRHLFATACIENEVDIPTVSRWLGHKDGGALAMKTYGHLRDEHSASAAKKVTFS